MMKEKGQSLLEALIALGAATLVMSAIAVAVISSVSNSDFSKYLNQATQYSQQGIEVLKQQSIADWATFSAYQGGLVYCFADGKTSLSNTSTAPCSSNIGANNFFVRTAVLNAASTKCPGNPDDAAHRGTLVSVSTAWSDGKCPASNLYCHDSTFNTCITDVNRVPAL